MAAQKKPEPKRKPAKSAARTRAASNQRLQSPELAKLLLTVEEVAHKLSVGRSAVYGLMRRGELRFITVGRVRRVPVDAVSEYVARAQGRAVA